MRSLFKNFYAGIIILIFLPSMDLLAADVDPGQQLLQDMNRQEQQYQNQKSDLAWQTPKEQTSLANNTECLPIKSFVVEDAEKLNASVMQKILQFYQKSCITIFDVDTLLSNITAAYVEKGYVTSKAFVGQQTLKNGVLKITVSEGKIERYSLNGNSLRDKIKLWAAFPSQKDNLLNLNTLSQGISNLQNASSSAPSIQIMPGIEFGKSVIAIHNKIERPVRFRMGYDNQGTSLSGEKRVRAGLELDNLLAMNDTWSGYYLGSLDSNAFALSGSIPFRDWMLNLSTSYSEYFADIENTLSAILTQTDTESASLKRVVFRDHNQKVFLSTGLDLKETTMQLDGATLTPKNLTVMHAGLQYEKRFSTLFFIGDIGLSKGLRALGADSKLANGDFSTPDPQFIRLELNGAINRSFESFGISSQFTSQWSKQTLPGTERFNLGGVHSVRGYVEGAATGDIGFNLQNEVSINPTVFFQKSSIQAMGISPYGFLDAGYGIDHADVTSKLLSGVGLGVRYQWRGISADFAVAKAMSEHDLSLQRIHFNVDLRLW